MQGEVDQVSGCARVCESVCACSLFKEDGDAKGYSSPIATVRCVNYPPLLSQRVADFSNTFIFLTRSHTLSCQSRFISCICFVISLFSFLFSSLFPQCFLSAFIFNSFYLLLQLSLFVFTLVLPTFSFCKTDMLLSMPSLLPSTYSSSDMTVHLCSQSHIPVNQSAVI